MKAGSKNDPVSNLDTRLHDFKIVEIGFYDRNLEIVAVYNAKSLKLVATDVMQFKILPYNQPLIIGRVEVFKNTQQNRDEFKLENFTSNRQNEKNEEKSLIVSIESVTDWKFVIVCDRYDIVDEG